MGLTYAIQGLQPAYGTPKPLPLSCSLPYGGRTNVGSGAGTKFLQGMALSVISTTNANEVRTLTLASTPSGTVTVVIYGAAVNIVFSFAYNASPATGASSVQALLLAAYPAWTGNVAVTGTAGSSYVFTFGSQLGNQAIGGNWTASITAGTATWARTTSGSSTCQLDEYNASNNNNAIEGFLEFDAITDFTGANVGPDFGVATNQPASQSYMGSGIYVNTSLVGLDSNAYTLGGLIKTQGGNNTALLR